MAITKITKGELRKTFKARMEALAARHGLLVDFTEYDEFHACFREAGARHHTSAIATEFDYPRYSYGRAKDEDVKVERFVVSGKFLDAKENSARGASSPWSSRYVKTADYDKALAALESTTRKDNPKERIETAAFEAKGRWNCNDYERRHPGLSKIELAVIANARDGVMLKAEGDDVSVTWLGQDIAAGSKAVDRYVGAWMAVEIIEISRKVELASLGIES